MSRGFLRCTALLKIRNDRSGRRRTGAENSIRWMRRNLTLHGNPANISGLSRPLSFTAQLSRLGSLHSRDSRDIVVAAMSQFSRDRRVDSEVAAALSRRNKRRTLTTSTYVARGVITRRIERALARGKRRKPGR